MLGFVLKALLAVPIRLLYGKPFSVTGAVVVSALLLVALLAFEQMVLGTRHPIIGGYAIFWFISLRWKQSEIERLSDGTGLATSVSATPPADGESAAITSAPLPIAAAEDRTEQVVNYDMPSYIRRGKK